MSIPRFRHRSVAIFFIFLLVVTISWRLLISPGTLGMRDDWPIPPLNEQNVDLAKYDTLYSWGSDALGHPINRQAGSYVDWFWGGLARAIPQVNGWLISRYPIGLLMIGGVGMLKFLRSREIESRGAVLGASVYLLSPFVFNSFISGYLKFFVSYATVPFFFWLFLDWLEQRSFRSLILSAIFFGLISTQANFLVLFGAFIPLLLGYGWLTRTRGSNSWQLLWGGALLYLGPLLLQAPLFLEPIRLIFGGQGGEIIGSFSRALDSFITLQAHPIYYAISLVGLRLDYFFPAVTSRGDSLSYLWQWLRIPFLLLPLCAIYFKRRDQFVALMAIIWIGGLFLFKGPNPPFGYFTSWLFSAIPFFSVLRNLSYLSILIVPALAALVSLGSMELLNRTPKRGQLMVFAGLFSLIAFLSWPLFSGDFFGQIRPYQVSDATISNYRALRAEPGLFRVWQLPMHQPMEIDTGAGASYPGNNPFVWHPAKPPLWMGVHETYAHQYHSLLSTALHLGQSRQVGYLLSLANVREAVLDFSVRSRFTDFIISGRNTWLSNRFTVIHTASRLAEQQDLVKTSDQGTIKIWQNQRFAATPVVATAGPILVVGGNQIVAAQADSALPNELGRPFIFAANLSSDSPSPPLNDLSRVWIEPGDEETLTAMFLPRRFSFDPAVGAARSSAHPDGEWVQVYLNQWWWYHQTLSSAERPVLTFAGNQTLTLPITAESDRSRLFVKLWHSPRSHELRFLLDGKKLSTKATFQSERASWRWVELPKVSKGDHLLSLQTGSASEEAVARVLVVPEAAWQEATARVDQFIHDKQVVYVYPEINPGELSRYPTATYLTGSSRIIPVGEAKATGTTSQPLLDNPGFESGAWATDPSCAPKGADGIEASSEGATEGHQKLILYKRSPDGFVCVRRSLSHLNPKATYRISFFYRWQQGGAPYYTLWEVKDGKLVGGRKQLVSDPTWSRQELYYRPGTGVSGLAFEFGTDRLKDSTIDTQVEFDSVAIEEQNENGAILLTNRLTSPLGDPPIPLSATQLDPTRYTVTVPPHKEIVFEEHFHPDWQVWQLDEVGQKVTRLSPTAHYEVSSFANAFVLPNGAAGKILFEFGAQPFYRVLVIVQMVAVLISLLLLITIGWRRRR